MSNATSKQAPVTAEKETMESTPYYHSTKAQKARRILQLVLSRKSANAKN